jgi:hypothetical protein
MATLIHINRDSKGVTYQTVSVITSELVVWVNNDTLDAHWPSLSPNPIGPAPSPNSSAVPLVNPGGAPPATPPNLAFQVKYTDKEPKYSTLTGLINVFNPFQAGTLKLPAASVNQAIQPQTVATGGVSPYSITGQLFQVANSSGAIIASGSGPGPGLTLTATTNNAGITVTGTPTLAGTYTFTFNATDGMGLNVQQSQFTMVVS